MPRGLGLTLDENGRALLLVETPAPLQRNDEFFCYLEGVRQHGGRQLHPTPREIPARPAGLGREGRFSRRPGPDRGGAPGEEPTVMNAPLKTF